MRHGAQRHLETEVLVRRALAEQAVVVHYQTVVSLRSGAVLGTEALVRVPDAKGRLVPPNVVIPVAEDTGLIVPLGLEVLRQACLQYVRWLSMGAPPTWVSVNLSPRQLRSFALVDDVTGVLSNTGMKAEGLCLELTESMLLEVDNRTKNVLGHLTEVGIAIALDDFGTGMSSLAYLRRFPVRVLKIDRSFVSGLGQSHDDNEVVRSVIGLGSALGLNVVAEGVETEAQAAMLSELGCPEAQGFLFSRPRPGQDLWPVGASN